MLCVVQKVCPQLLDGKKPKLPQTYVNLELLPDFTGWRTPGMQAGGNLMDPGPETDEDGGIMGEFDNMVHWTVADAAMEDDIGDQLLGLDNLHPSMLPLYHCL